MEDGNVFHNDPALGFIATGTILLVTEISKVVDHHMPPMIMDLFQIMAWSSAVTIGMITVHGWYVKNIRKKPENENKSSE